METPGSRRPQTDREFKYAQRWLLVLGIGSLLIVGLTLVLPRPGKSNASSAAGTNSAAQAAVPGSSSSGARHFPPGAIGPAATPEEIVAQKVTRFAQDRLRITHAMAKRFQVEVAPDVERFFAAVAAGDWKGLNEAFEALKQRRDSDKGKDLQTLWGPILETLLIAECSHDWPAQKLLDYGDATLGALRPGMVYVGGTDPGRGIPTLLNETSDGERHIVLTQNALADGTYLKYVDFLYGDRVATLTPEDSQAAFNQYLTDAQKRLAHDQQFSNEPKQIRPGEDVRIVNNRTQVSGQVAVMAINEQLLRMFMNKNPDLSFALEESYPLQSTYPNAAPLGALMELEVQDVQNSFTQDRAVQAVNYWQDLAQGFLAEPELKPDSPPRLSYAKMAAAQGALLAAHQYSTEAEQAYRAALQISSGSPEAVYGLGRLLAQNGRHDEARELIGNFERNHPNNNNQADVWRLFYGMGSGPTAGQQ